MPRITTLVILSALLLLSTPVAFSGDQVKIGSILADPSAYAHRIVTLEGMVQNPQLQEYISGVTGTKKCNQYFRLVDETGAINAISLSHCEMGGQTATILDHGDRVVIEANIQLPGSNTAVLGGKDLGLHVIVRSMSKK